MKRTLLLGAALLVASVCHAREIMIPLRYADGEGVRRDLAFASLAREVPAPDAGGVIAIEAEGALRHQFDPNVRDAGAPMPEDPDAVGGEYLDQAVFASYEFLADRAGDYWLWVRVRTGEGRWRFRDVVNGTIWYFFDEGGRDEAPENAAQWHWMPRRKVTLREGFNRLALTDYAYSFPQIDRFVFAPAEDWTPEGAGPASVTRENAEGWVETAPIDIPGLQGVVAIQGLPHESKRVQWRFSDGSARSEWTALDVPVDANGFPQSQLALGLAAGDGPLQFRVALGPVPDAGSILSTYPSVTAEVTERCVEMLDGNTRLLLDRETAALLMVAERGAISSPSEPRPLFSIDFKLPGERRVMRVDPESVTEFLAEYDENRGWPWKPQVPQEVTTAPQSVEVAEDRFAASWVLAVEGMGRAEVGYTISLRDGGGLAMDITVRHLEGPADVVAVKFPRMENVALGSSGLDDVQFRMQSFGHEVVNPGTQPLRDAAYCGQVVMPWQEVYDGRMGLYVGAHDPEAYNCEFTSRSGGLAAEQFSFAPRKLDDIKPGEERTYPYVVAVHGGGWHEGADIYREWFGETFGHAQYPEFMATMDGWLNLQAENMRESFRFSHLPDMLTRGRAIGLDWTQVWGQFSYDGGPCCHDFGEPSPLYGGREGWEAACREIVRRGGRVGGYFIYDRLDQVPITTDWLLGHFPKAAYPPETPWVSGEMLSELMVVTDPGGELPQWPPAAAKVAEWQELIDAHQEVYAAGSRASAVVDWQKVWCNDPAWREWMRGWIADRYATDWGANACYIDVLGCGSTMESYDPRRGHNGEGSWGLGKLEIARTITESAREVFPDFAPTMEGLGDLPGLYCASMASGVYRGGRNVMRYTFPDRILIHGLANSGSGGEAIDRYAETFLEGMRYDFVGMPAADGVRWLHLHRSFTPWLYQARFMDTVGLSASDPRVKVRRFDLPEGAPEGVLLTVVNRERLAQETVTIDEHVAGNVERAYYVTMDGEVGAIEPIRMRGRFDSLVRFPVPDAVASQMLLVSGAAEGPALWPVTRLMRYPEPVIEVALLNLSGEAQSGSCALANLGFPEPREAEIEAARASLPLAETRMAFELAPGAVQTLRFPIESLRHHDYTVRLGATIERDGAPAIAREFLALPLMLDASFEALGTASDFPEHGERVLELGPSARGYQYAPQPLWLEPGHSYRLEVGSRRTGFDARVHSTALQVHGVDESGPIVRAPVDATRPNEWQRLEYEFETPADLSRATLYLYNVESPDTAYFDDVYIEDLGPAE